MTDGGTTAHPHDDYDLIVVGAGPAGSAAAVAALRERPGARVLLLDREPPGRDKVCGDGIAPHAARALTELGIDAVRDDEIVPTVRLTGPGGTTATGDSPGYVVPRARFDERMLNAATDAGAEFRRERVTALTQDEHGVTVNGAHRAPIVIGADGSTSAVRRLVGEQSNSGRALAVAVRGYAPTPSGASDRLELRWDARRRGGLCYAWAFPTTDGTSNVGYGVSAAASAGGRAELVERMRALLPEYDLDGLPVAGHTLPLAVRRPRPSVGRVLLVGDAASLVNPLTGEGIYSAIRSGALAGHAGITTPSRAGDVYRRALRTQFGRQHRQMRLLYALIDSHATLEAVVRACRADRRLVDRLLDVGLGDRRFRPTDVARFLAAGARAA